MALPLILHYSLNKTEILKTNHNCEKGMLKNVKISIESLFFFDVVSKLQRCVHTKYPNTRMCDIQFVCTHRFRLQRCVKKFQQCIIILYKDVES